MLKCRSGPKDKLMAEKVMTLKERSAGQNLEVHLDVGSGDDEQRGKSGQRR